MDQINILIVEDNLVVQQYLKSALAMEPRNNILETISDGRTAIERAQSLQPDIILLDLLLPEMDGIEVIQRVMHRAPCPIVVISGELNRQDRDLTFEAQRAGAVDVLSKPFGMDIDKFEAFSDLLNRTVKVMSQVKVTRRWFDCRNEGHVSDKEIEEVIDNFASDTMPDINIDGGLLLIGSSTGGPSALYGLLSCLPDNFPFSVLIAQHITEGFSSTLASWLSKTSCQVSIAKDGEKLERSKVYIADDAHHLVLGANELLHQVKDSRQRFTPSVDLLFQSVAENYHGKVCAMILTGMGDDGSIGIETLFHRGAYTIAESEVSSVIFGMPKMAIATGCVRKILELDALCLFLKNLAQNNK